MISDYTRLENYTKSTLACMYNNVLTDVINMLEQELRKIPKTAEEADNYYYIQFGRMSRDDIKSLMNNTSGLERAIDIVSHMKLASNLNIFDNSHKHGYF